jgi:hypothetical protein
MFGSTAATPPKAPNRQVTLAFEGKTPIPEKLLMPKANTQERLLARHDGNKEMPWYSNSTELGQARGNQSLFTKLEDMSIAQQSPLANPRRLSDDRLWIRYNIETLSAKVEGDQFTLELPKLGPVNARIKRVEGWDGGYRWSGTLLEPNLPGSTFHISQIRSASYALGTITTPKGEFELQSLQGIGWIAHGSDENFFGDDDVIHKDHSPRETSGKE